MGLYAIALFAHIVGAVLIFVLLTTEGLGLRLGFPYGRVNQALGPISAALILVPGIYMMSTSWGWTGWIATGIATYALIAVSGAYTGLRVMRHSMSTTSATVSWLTRVGLALSVVFIMTVKPDLPFAIIAVLVGATIGAATGFGLRRTLQPS